MKRINIADLRADQGIGPVGRPNKQKVAELARQEHRYRQKELDELAHRLQAVRPGTPRSVTPASGGQTTRLD